MYESDSDEDTIIDNYLNRHERNHEQRINYNLEDPTFIERFRLTPSSVEALLSRIGHLLLNHTTRIHDMEPRTQLLTALNFFASGGFYHNIADSHGISKATVCRCVREVTTAINAILFDEIISWNTSDAVAEAFYSIAGIPTICGCIDGSHFIIKAPSSNEVAFVNRKSVHSINAMMVCDASMRFQYVSAKYPGSVHDSRVFKKSNIFRDFDTLNWRPFRNAVILGDSGYPLKDYLIVPFLRPENSQQRRFNRAHKSTRRLIECAFGILKERFRCLKFLRVKPTYACEIIKACCVMHNLCLMENPEEIPSDEDDSQDLNTNMPEPSSENEYPESDEDEPVLNNASRRDQLVDFFL